MNLFISYSSTTHVEAEKICSMLEAHGIRCFLAPRDIPAGISYATAIISGMEHADAMLLLLSERANVSPHVLREVEHAVSTKLPILVFMLEEVTLSDDMKYFLMADQWINTTASNDYSLILPALRRLPNALPADTLPVSFYDTPPSRKGSKNSVFLVIIGILVLALFGLGASFFLYVQQQNVASELSPVEAALREQEEKELPSSASPAKASVQEESLDEESLDEESAEALQNAFSIGNQYTFGSYLGEPISWTLIRMETDFESTPEKLILFSDDILSIKCFDPANSGKAGYYGYELKNMMQSYEADFEDIDAKYDAYCDAYGNNEWIPSAIRTWLNCENMNPYYSNVPTKEAVYHGSNSYAYEAGFLQGFSEEERACLSNIYLTQRNNVREMALNDTCIDTCFLLSEEELDCLKQAKVPLTTKMTNACQEQNTCEFSEENLVWALRDPAPDSVQFIQCVDRDGKIVSRNAYDDSVGIRPALVLDAKAYYLLLFSP